MKPVHVITNNSGIKPYHVPDQFQETGFFLTESTCGFCSLAYVLKVLYGHQDVREDVLKDEAMGFSCMIGKKERPLTYIGEVFHPVEFRRFVAERFSIPCEVAEYSHEAVVSAIDGGGFVMAPFNVGRNTGLPVPSAPNQAHWCVIAGYRREEGKLFLLAHHWGRHFDFEADRFQESNARISFYTEHSFREDPNDPDSERFFSEAELREVLHLRNRMIIFHTSGSPPSAHPVRERQADMYHTTGVPRVRKTKDT